MEVALSSSLTIISFSTTLKFSSKPSKTPILPCNLFPITTKLKSKKNTNQSSATNYASKTHNLFPLSSSSSSSSSSLSSTLSNFTSCYTSGQNHHWVVVMDTPPRGVSSRHEIIHYYVRTLQSVLGSEKDAQMCMYDASCDNHFGFGCDVDEETARELARLPGVLSVRPESDSESTEKDCSIPEVQLGPLSNTLFGGTPLFPSGNSKHWLVRMEKPAIGIVTKAQMVDYITQILTKVMGNEMDAQMCIYHVSWQFNFGFCCELDEDCAQELAGMPGVLSVQPDENFESDNKDYGGENLQQFGDSTDSSQANETTNVKTKKLFVAGLSFYTSEKTLRAAFEGFGELVEVKIIIDKISKRSKGYAFLEYTTEEAAGAALKEMNGKIINGWMISVDVAKINPPKYSRVRPRPIVR